MRIGILGGSFNPPHNGHLYLGRELKNRLQLDRIIVIPAKKPPHKDNIVLAPDNDRLNMCRILFSDSFFSVSDIEMQRDGKSFTFDTLTFLKKMYPRDDLFLLVGADMLLYFDKWYRWQDILKLCTLCAFARDSEHSYGELVAYSRDVLENENIIIENVPPLCISSTEIRNKIKNGENAEGLLPKELCDYILNGGLYREG